MAKPISFTRNVCLSELSKDVKGQLHLGDSLNQRCRQPKCATLSTVHAVELDVNSYKCDSPTSGLFDGRVEAKFVTKFTDGDGKRRGVHEGEFHWAGAQLEAQGTMQGLTNLGTHRGPTFHDCQSCDEVGVMEGMFIGTVTKARSASMVGCELRVAYRLSFDHASNGGSGAISGALEGVVLCDCP